MASFEGKVVCILHKKVREIPLGTDKIIPTY